MGTFPEHTTTAICNIHSPAELSDTELAFGQALVTEEDDADWGYRYHRAMLRFTNSLWFGFGMKRLGSLKELPIHSNTRFNPRSWSKLAKNGKTVYRTEAHWMRSMSYQHLTGKRAGFHVSAGNRARGLFALDSDGEAGTNWRDAAAYTLQVLASLFPNLTPFMEPSRSWPRKGGAYVWYRVDWQGYHPAVRAAIELALSRELKRIANQIIPPPGIKYDDCKGRTTFEYDNPRFMPSLAIESDGSGDWPEYDIGRLTGEDDEVWVRAYEAKQGLRRCHRLATEDTIMELLATLPNRGREVTVLERYEKEKIFYGCSGTDVNKQARIGYDPRLEQRSRFFGVLVTRPCYKALSGERENNIPEFLKWLGDCKGQITVKKILQVLPAEAREQIDRVQQAVDAGTWPRLPRRVAVTRVRTVIPSSATGQSAISPPHEICSPTPCRGNLAIMADETVGPWQRRTAAVRYYLGQTNGNVALAADQATWWYEAVGIATDDGPNDHEVRLEKTFGIAEHYAKTFNPRLAHPTTGANTSQDPWFTREDVAHLADLMTSVIPDELLAGTHANPRHRPTRPVIAAVYAIFLKNIATNDLHAVPVESIRRGLVSIGMGRNNGIVAAATQVLLTAGQIRMTRNYSVVPEGIGDCRRWQLGDRAVIPDWIKPLLLDASRGSMGGTGGVRGLSLGATMAGQGMRFLAQAG